MKPDKRLSKFFVKSSLRPEGHRPAASGSRQGILSIRWANIELRMAVAAGDRGIRSGAAEEQVAEEEDRVPEVEDAVPVGIGGAISAGQT